MEQSKQYFYKKDCSMCKYIAEILSGNGTTTFCCADHIGPKEINLLDKPSEDINLQEYTTKDSGERIEFSTGMKRDVQTDKPRYDLIGSGWELIKRWAQLMARGAIKYGELNFEKAATEEELKRFKASGLRHMIQWFEGETDEDHAAAVCFNIAGAEMVKRKLNN